MGFREAAQGFDQNRASDTPAARRGPLIVPLYRAERKAVRQRLPLPGGQRERWLPFHDRLDETVIPNNVKLLEYFRKHGMTVTYAQIACLREDGEDRSPVQKSDGWNGIFLPINNPETQIIDELAPQRNEIVVSKTTDSVTTGTNYLTLLNFMGIETVVVTGIVTDQCVACSVRGLADAGYKVICVEDACAAGSMELHDAELKIMSVIYCDVLVLPLCFIYSEMTRGNTPADGQNGHRQAEDGQ